MIENRISWWTRVGVAGVSLVLIAVHLNPFRFVENGENKVVFSWFGGVNTKPLEPGFHFVAPLVTRTYSFDVKTQALTWKDEDSSAYGPRLVSLSQDGQEIRSEVTLQFRVEDAPTLLQTLGLSYIDRIAPIVRSIIASETADFSAQDLYSTQRPILQSQIREQIALTLRLYGISVNDFLLRDVDFSPDFVKAIESKTIAENELIQKQFEIGKARQDARSIVAQAEAEAGRLQAKADALASNPQYLDVVEAQVLGETLDVLITKVDDVPSNQN